MHLHDSTSFTEGSIGFREPVQKITGSDIYELELHVHTPRGPATLCFGGYTDGRC